MLLTSYIPPRFRFFLKSAGDYYTVAPNGVVVLNNVEKSVQEPIGWKETEIKWARSLTYWGLVTTLTTAYKFVEDGAKILRYIYNTQGVDGKCRLVVQKRNKSDFTYTTFYEGEVNFATFLDEDVQVTVNVEQGGLNALFRANESTPYEVVAPQEPIRMDGVALRNKSIMQVSGSTTATDFMPSITNIFNESDLAPSTRNQAERVLGIQALMLNYPFFVAQNSGDVTVEYSIKVNLSASSGSSAGSSNTYVVILYRYDPATNAKQELVLMSATGSTLFGSRKVTGTVTITLNKGEQISLLGALKSANGAYMSSSTNGGNTSFDIKQSFSEGTLKISYYTRIPESTAGASRYYEVVANTMAILSGGTAVMNMPFLTSSATTSVYNRPYHTWLATAQEVRGLPGKYKLKFSDLFKDLHGRWLLGLGIVGNTATIAPLVEFFQDIELADLGDVTNFQVEPANDLLFSDIKLGMKTVSADQLNGRFEIISDQTWKAPLLRTEKSRDASSPFVGGMYSIEKIRNEIGKDTTNTEPDNDIVVLETEANKISGRYSLYRPLYPLVVNGLAQQVINSAFNLTLRPRLDLLRNKPLLSVVCHNVVSTKSVTFQTAEREGNITTYVGGVFVDDRSPVAIADLGPRPVLPVRFRFLATVPDNLYQLLSNTPYGYFTFSYKGNQYKGFVDELSQNTADDAAVTCSLLAHPATDLTTLIR